MIEGGHHDMGALPAGGGRKGEKWSESIFRRESVEMGGKINSDLNFGAIGVAVPRPN
ncbi:MAG: hypothetical protein IT513_00385 [Burkholderiales bacterium]|nr:hypothetical protein [Burkholderiales bacterium]